MTTAMDGKSKLEAYLQKAGVEFETHEHPLAYTAQKLAEAEHVPGKTVAKVVMVMADDEPVMFVLPAPSHLDMAKARSLLKVRNVRLAEESEFGGFFPDCDVGAMPPIGDLYGIETFADEALTEDEYIVFQAGTHTDTIRMSYEDYARVAHPTVADVAMRPR